MEIWMLKDDEGDDVEFFSERPKTPGVTGQFGDYDNWPDQYTVRVGNLDGGDSLVIENRNALGEVWVRSEDDDHLWHMAGVR